MYKSDDRPYIGWSGKLLVGVRTTRTTTTTTTRLNGKRESEKSVWSVCIYVYTTRKREKEDIEEITEDGYRRHLRNALMSPPLLHVLFR